MGEKETDRVVAQGNHRYGYRGAIVRDWDEADEKVVAHCTHLHPTTAEARACINGSWNYGRGLDGIVLPKAR